ncbi:MAG: hypothetical protein JXA99_03835 [Candidatus Lokiarchaeota archaeon]|nr:hypothetical protein [Candidatus Lokiarchaeota archaeon]
MPYIERKYVFIFLVLFGLLSLFFINHQDDAAKIQQLEQSLADLNQKYQSLETEHNLLQIEYTNFKKDTSKLLSEYFAKEIAWDFIGLSKYKLVICALQIYLRDEMPIVNASVSELGV